MILLSGAGTDTPAPIVAVFGVGLLGSSIVSSLTFGGRMNALDLPLSWLDGPVQANHLQHIEEKIAGAISARDSALSIVWSAGRAGFGAKEEQTAVELAGFRAVLAMSERLAARFPAAGITFFLLSSTGGLFQGQRHVDSNSLPAPGSPYGDLKHRQEQLLVTSDPSIVKRIYRLTSVYGHVRSNQRLGLITTMLLNGARYGVTPITASMSTLRDFIFTEDVARFLRPLLLETARGSKDSTDFLAQGKPSSLMEIQRLVETVVGRRIYVQYSPDPSNRDDITVSPSALPSGWQPTDMRSNIIRIYRQAIHSGAVFGGHDRR